MDNRRTKGLDSVSQINNILNDEAEQFRIINQEEMKGKMDALSATAVCTFLLKLYI